MTQPIQLSADTIRAKAAEHTGKRPRDLADVLGITEAALLTAGALEGDVRPISAHPDMIMPGLSDLGPVMALTRNDSAVHEKTGIYDNYRSGPHAAMVLNDAIDLRLFASHWVHGFAITTDTKNGPRRSLQVFDAAGDAIHKVYTRDQTDLSAWDRLVDKLAAEAPSDPPQFTARAPIEKAKSDLSKVEMLRSEWVKMTDTHQFMRLTSKLKMNRLGAYRIVGEPFVTPLHPNALNDALIALGQTDTEVMLFVGNRGCIQIHSGPVNRIQPMGPWQNVLDPDFNLHLRTDHVAEVWAVEKPTKRGPALSIEAFDAEDRLILQMFGRRKETDTIDHTEALRTLITTLPRLHKEDA